MKKRHFVLFVLFLSCASFVNALTINGISRSVKPINVLSDTWFTEGNATHRELIENISDEYFAFVPIQVSEILKFNDDGSEVLSPISLYDTKEKSILYSPSRLIIPPSSNRRVTFFYDSEFINDKDHFFRVAYKPSEPSEGDGVQISEDKEKTSASLGISSYWSQLLIIGKDNPKFNTVITNDGKSIRNEGDSYIKISDRLMCKSGKCDRLGDKILLSGKQLSLSTKGYTEGQYTIQEREKKTEITWRL